MNRPKMRTCRACVDPALGILERLFDERRRHGGYWDDPIRTTILLEFRFFKMFFWGLDHWQVSKENDWILRTLPVIIGDKLRRAVEEFQARTELVSEQDEFTTWEQGLDQLKKIIELLKRQVNLIFIFSMHGERGCKPCQQDLKFFLECGRETASFIELVLENLKALNSENHLIEQQIDFITGILKVFKKFADAVSHSISGGKNLGRLISETRTWANHLSCLACQYWIDGLNESVASTVETKLADFMQKTMSCTPGVVASYFDGAPFIHILARNFNFHRKELVMLATEDDIETLWEGLIFLFSFMTDPSEEDSEDRGPILGQICSIINELPSPICSIRYNKTRERIAKIELSKLLEKIAGVKVAVGKIYAITPNSSQFNSPRTNAIGFLDSLLKKLKKWLDDEVFFVAHSKHSIQTVREELSSLEPFMQRITELQNEQEELKDLWSRVINVVYHASYVPTLCSAKSFSIWHRIICLQSVIEEIKLIKIEAEKIKDLQMHKNKMLIVRRESKNTLLPRATTSKVEGAFIGFEEETRSIMNYLTRGVQHRTIISISGMPGQGKTTLAKKIYNDSQIKRHFLKTAWCYVSKECKIRDLLIHILHDVTESDEDISKLEIQDLAEKLYRCLKQRRYLVVMDDIWDVGEWCQVQSSFPDDKVGSRILFTSRNHNLMSQAELNFVSYPLRSFSEEESWNLMKEKLFHSNRFGQEFLDIGKQIANSCKGLPLAVALAASLLGRTEQKLDLWNQVAENLNSHLASEGCMHIIELSYKYLPDHLKSCFLYFGAFPRGANISAKRLKLLWMAEGFINENETLSSEYLAEDCLDDLVSQSLVVVAGRRSMGRIKRCNVHDLLYDLCLEKIAEDNFLYLTDRNTVLDECRSSPQMYGDHRLCVGRSNPLIASRRTCRRMELTRSLVQSLLWLDRFPAYDFDGVVFVTFLKSFKVLTVLDLEEVEMKGDGFPEQILCNIHLKYLALLERIKNIPPSIADLWNLETLILRAEAHLACGVYLMSCGG